jgi:glycosyltransferase involved in cell wall biosynthesis
MNFLIISHVPHKQVANLYYGYAPYVREMNIWSQFTDSVTIIAPFSKEQPNEVEESYSKQKIRFIAVKPFNLLGIKSILKAIVTLPVISFKVALAMKKADHIHLRCPGNMGLLGCFIQIFFPGKPKTAKYAGNWAPDSGQPWSYRLQQWILNNTLLTRNMKVLVYGEWKGMSKNIQPFFTATYFESEKASYYPKQFPDVFRFVFSGALVPGKRPLYALKLIEEICKNGINAHLTLYGEGSERNKLSDYINRNNLHDVVYLAGNQNRETLKEAYQQSHFVVLPSESEGWPKAIAEGMFWGCVPVSTSVSCIPYMLDSGNRGILLAMDLLRDSAAISKLIGNKIDFLDKSKAAADWSHHFTMDAFEQEIEKLVIK